MNQELLDVQAGFRKGRGTKDQIANIHWIMEKSKRISEKHYLGPGSSDSKVFAYNVGELGSIPGSERSPGEGNGNQLQFSCLENPMDRGSW